MKASIIIALTILSLTLHAETSEINNFPVIGGENVYVSFLDNDNPLNKKVTFTFEDRDYQECMAVIQGYLGSDWSIDPGEYKEPITLKVNGMRLTHAIRWISHLTKTRITVKSKDMIVYYELDSLPK